MRLLIIILLGLTSMKGVAQNMPLTVIGNSQVPFSTLRFAELQSIYKGERQVFSNGTKIVLVLMKTKTDVGMAICDKVYNMDGEKVKRFWIGIQFAGKMDAPVFCNSELEVETIVSQTPGAIGIIGRPPQMGGIKIVLIDGKTTF